MKQIISIELECPYAVPCGDGIVCVCVQRMLRLMGRPDSMKLRVSTSTEKPEAE